MIIKVFPVHIIIRSKLLSNNIDEMLVLSQKDNIFGIVTFVIFLYDWREFCLLIGPICLY